MPTDHHEYTYNFDAPVDSPPTRVVSLVPSLTESLFDLNLGDRIVGVTDYCTRPEDRVAHQQRVGGPKNPDVGRIIALKPDLVLMSQEENRREDADALQAAGIPVWVTFPRSVQDVFNLLWAIMDVFDETSMVPRVQLIEQSFDWVSGSTRSSSDVMCRVFVPIWYDPLMTFNAETYMHDLLQVCGGRNVFANRQRKFPLEADLGLAESYPDEDPRVVGRDLRYPRITFEEVVAAQPDVILLPSEPYTFDESHITIFSGLDVPASHNHRIHLLDGSLLTWPGTRVAYALEIIPPLLSSMDEL